MAWLSWVRQRSVLVSIPIIATYIVLAGLQADRPLVMDEIEFPRLAEAVAETGRPVYYRGEQSPSHVGAFHPPSYGYTLGAWIAVFGYSEITVRSFGIILMIGTALVGVRIVTVLGLGGDLGPPIFLGLFLLHPFVIQSALLPDIDGTVLLLATVLLFYQVVRVSQPEMGTKSSSLRIGLVIGLALASKLTSLILLPFVFLGLLIGRGVKWAMTVTGLGFALGAGVFLVAWAGLAVIADLPFLFPFEFTIRSGLKGGLGQAGFGELIRRLKPADSTVYWLGILLPAMAAVGTIVLLSRWRVQRHRRVLLALSLWSLGSFVFFSLITGPPFGFPKYFIAALPTMAVLGVVTAEFAVERIETRRLALPSAGVVVVILAVISGAQSYSVAEGERYSWPGYFWILALLIFSTLACAALVRDWTEWLTGVGILGLLVATLAYGLGMSASQVSVNASIRYFPGEVGFEETVDRLRELVGPEDLILAPKDVGSATYNHYLEQEQLFLDPDLLAEALADVDVRYAVVRTDWDYSYLVFPEVESIIEAEMDLLETIGGFLIYGREEPGHR